jgi:hypothetical protein
MASEILGLFTTPEQYQLAQQQAQQAQAIQYANLDPMARANYGTFLAGQQLGGAIGGALGGEDPQLKLISMRQQLARQLDPTNLDSYKLVAQDAANRGDTQFAMAVADAGRQAAVQVAQANRERQMAIAPDIQKSQQAAVISQAIRQYKALPPTPEITQAIENLQLQLDFLSPKQKAEATPNEIQIARTFALRKGAEGSPEYNTEFDSQLTRLTTKEQKERNIPFGAEAERKSKSMYGKPYADLTSEEAGKVDKAVEQSEQAKAKAGATLLPNQPVPPKDWLSFSSFISKDPVMDRTSTIMSDAPAAIDIIKNSDKNSFSAASLPSAIAKLTGEGKNMSNQDIARYARAGGLADRLSQDVVGFFTGKKTDVTKEQAQQFATALYRGAIIERKNFIQDQAQSMGYDQSPNYTKTIEQLDKKLGQFKLVTPSGSQSPSSQQTNQPFDADKEQRYQAWKAKQSKGTP